MSFLDSIQTKTKLNKLKLAGQSSQLVSIPTKTKLSVNKNMSKRLADNQNKKTLMNTLLQTKHRGSNWLNRFKKPNKNQFFLFSNLTNLKIIPKNNTEELQKTDKIL